MNSQIIAREGISDFGEVSVSDVIEIVHLAVDNGDGSLEIEGWDKSEDRYTLTLRQEQGGLSKELRMMFYPRGDYTIVQDGDNSTIMATIQSINNLIISKCPLTGGRFDKYELKCVYDD